MIAEKDFYDRNVLDFASYEEYLDQQVTAEDLFFLEDQDAARKIVELGYKGKDFLSRDEFEAARQLALAGPLKRKEADEQACSAGKTFDDPFLDALAKREELVRTGKLATVIFIRDYVRGQEVSAYIDYGHRLRTESFEEYFSGARRLLPKRSDLSYYNWKTHTLFFNNSSTFQVLADSESGLLLLKHKRDRKTINVDPRAPTPGDNSSRTVLQCKGYLQVTLYDHVTRRKN